MSFGASIQSIRVVALALGVAGCSSDGSDDNRNADAANAGSGGSATGGASTATGGSDTGNTGGAAPSDSGVASSGGMSTGGYAPSVCDGRDDPYEQGMTKNGELGTGMTVSLTDANPAPPQQCDDCNRWTLMIEDGDGNPIEGAVIEVDPRMPDHGHGTPIVAEVEDRGGGTYYLDPLSLFMKGYWTIAVDVTPPDGEPDSVLFKFCVPPGSS
jgi:hypothetical protein